MEESTPKFTIKKSWYKDWFADERYLALYRHRNDVEAGKLLDLIEKTVAPSKDAAILDLACGAGRHSIAFAKRGYQHITGVDLSATLITKAREAAEAAGVSVRFIESDMREFTGKYDLIVNLFTSFGYFESDDDNAIVLNRVASALNDGGYFVIDYFNATQVAAKLEPHTHKTLPGGEEVEEWRAIDNGRVNKSIIITKDGVPKNYCESVRLFTYDELRALIEQASMTLVAVFGNYDGDPFAADTSMRCIIFAKK